MAVQVVLLHKWKVSYQSGRDICHRALEMLKSVHRYLACPPTHCLRTSSHRPSLLLFPWPPFLHLSSPSPAGHLYITLDSERGGMEIEWEDWVAG